MTFAKKTKIGDIGEQLLIDRLASYGYESYKNDNYSLRYDHDIYIENPRVTFESKYDAMASLTGNLAIEYWNSRKNEASGIIRSKADYWVHIISVQGEPIIYIADRHELLRYMNKITPLKKIVSGGDGNSDMYIYKKEQLINCEEDDDIRPLVRLTREVAYKLIGEPNEK